MKLSVLYSIDLAEAKNNDITDEIRKIIAKQFWGWLLQHWEDKLVTVKILIFNKTVRVRDLESLFVLLFGPKPT